MQRPLILLTLDRNVTERLPKEVLGRLPTSVARVTADGYDHLTVLGIVGKEALEAICKLHEVLVLGKAAFKEARLDLCHAGA